MSYRGRDLDLRTPERWPQPPAGWRGDTQPQGALMVDEAVLACCNYAYDLALAHRAREVRVEHLLNAMARTDAAIAVMMGHGIDVAGLRQDTAQLIAADSAAVLGHERVSPRRSQELADVLNFAAAGAMARQASATIADVLLAIYEMNIEQSGVVMLKRNSPGWPRGVNDGARSEPLPPLGGYGYERFSSPEPAGEWVRVPAAQPQYAPPVQGGYYQAEPAPAASGNLTDVVQNTRLDQLERTIRDLTGELQAERRVVAQLVGDRRGEMPAEPVRTSRPREERPAASEAPYYARFEGGGGGNLADHLAGIERSVDAKFAEVARGWSILGERLQALEETIVSTRDPALPIGLSEQLQGLESVGSTLAKLADKLATIERQVSAIERGQAARPAVDLQPVIDRIATMERALATRVAPVDLAPVLDRIAGLERTIASRQVTVDLSPVVDRIGAIDARVAQFERRIEASIAGADRAAQQSAERQRALDEAIAAQRREVAQVSAGLAAEIKMIGQSLAVQAGHADRIQAFVGERFKTLGIALDEQRLEFASLSEAERTTATAATTEVANRIGALEKAIHGFGERTIELHSAHGSDLVELHNALVKLNGNQQTLAETLDQWRITSSNEVSSLLGRLDGVERATVKPVQMLEQMQGNVDQLYRLTLRREEQRGRFKQWLMGTDDWYGASWEDGVANGRPANGTTTSVPRTSTGVKAGR